MGVDQNDVLVVDDHQSIAIEYRCSGLCEPDVIAHLGEFMGIGDYLGGANTSADQ